MGGTYYDVLGVRRDASMEELTSAWRSLARNLHPDQHPGSSPAEQAQWDQAMAAVNEAYTVLKDPGQRREYNDALDSYTARSTMRPPNENECILCGSGPAAAFTFSHQVAFLIASRATGLEGRLCRNCAQGFGRSKQNRTLWTGWWGFPAVFVNLAHVGRNAGQLVKARRLDAPHRDPDVVAPLPGPVPPGRSVFARTGVWAVALLLVVLAASGAADTAQPDTQFASVPSAPPSIDWKITACVDENSGTGLVYPVTCDEPHIGVVVAQARSQYACPSSTDATVGDDASGVWCIAYTR